MSRMFLQINGALAGLFLCGACAPGLRLTLQNASVQKPGNVVLYFSAEHRSGVPAAGMEAEAFKIYEDQQLISAYESKQTILNPEVAVEHYTILLLDLSGSITESGTLPALTAAAESFSDKVSRTHKVAVYGFAGGPKLIPIVEFTSSAAAVRAGVERLAQARARDPSTNLNGALVEATRVLEEHLARSSLPLRFATLVVFTDGTDRAHRVSEDQMRRTLNDSQVNVFAIGLGPEISAADLARIGRAGHVKAVDQANIAAAFDQVAAMIEAASKKFYLLSYCSPSRAGVHLLTVEATHEKHNGSLSYEFNSDGFGPGCDPNAKPRFSIGKIRYQ